jgi:cell fate (sporulation/competence/biofilm development) regulator YlbF (YheA/YmcA/DUF963 family)
MADIIQLAEQLGKAIGDAPEATAMREARQAVAAKPQLRQMLNDYQQQINRIGRMEHEGKPVEVTDKQKLQALHDKLIADADFKKLTEAQMDYVELLRKINNAVRQQLKGTEAE